MDPESPSELTPADYLTAARYLAEKHSDDPRAHIALAYADASELMSRGPHPERVRRGRGMRLVRGLREREISTADIESKLAAILRVTLPSEPSEPSRTLSDAIRAETEHPSDPPPLSPEAALLAERSLAERFPRPNADAAVQAAEADVRAQGAMDLLAKCEADARAVIAHLDAHPEKELSAGSMGTLREIAERELARVAEQRRLNAERHLAALHQRPAVTPPAPRPARARQRERRAHRRSATNQSARGDSGDSDDPAPPRRRSSGPPRHLSFARRRGTHPRRGGRA